jgi:lysozyme
LKTSTQGLAAIRQREGCRLSAYKDSVGVWTIGVGHTGRMSPPLVHPGMTISLITADQYLAADLAPTEAAINSWVKVPLSVNQFDALASITFNIGTTGFRGSSFLKQLNLGNYTECANDFLMWDIPSVLIGRRRAERAQFLTPDRSPT